MPILESKPKIKYGCSCGAVSSAEPEEFVSRNTHPPTYIVKCAYCNLDVICSPTAMIHREVGQLTSNDKFNYIKNIQNLMIL